jgi:hypothetical protein
MGIYWISLYLSPEIRISFDIVNVSEDMMTGGGGGVAFIVHLLQQRVPCYLVEGRVMSRPKSMSLQIFPQSVG